MWALCLTSLLVASGAAGARKKKLPRPPTAKAAAPAKPATSIDAEKGMVDCALRENEAHVRCVLPQAGTVGSGPKFVGAQVNHGFVSGNRLVVAVASGDEHGGVFGIDLATGARALLSGKYNDVGTIVTRGNGKPLAHVRDVAQAPNNRWVAFAAESPQSNRVIVSIDPATGDRSVLFDAYKAPCVGMTGDVAFDIAAGIAVGPDGVVYVGLNNMPGACGKGIARIESGKCSMITLSGALNGNAPRGSGPILVGTTFHDLAFRGGQLFLHQTNTHPSVLAIDPASGNRMMISVNPDKGAGPDVASDAMAVGPDGTIWTYHAFRNGTFGLVSIDPATGNRTRHEAKAGPAKKATSPDHGIWVHPDGKHLLLHYANAILIFDPATGNSNTLSY